MNRVELLGNVRSPYVRRVRIVALELGVKLAWIDTDVPEGEALLRELNPLWKMPVARFGAQVLFESGLISRELLRLYGPEPLAPWDERDGLAQTLLATIDGVLDSRLNVAYLGRDGIAAEASAYLRKQQARAEHALGWLERQSAEWLRQERQLGLVDIAWVTTCHTLRTRHAMPLEQHPNLVAWAERYSNRSSVILTGPEAPPPA
jgi:glutathione S-transferase